MSRTALFAVGLALEISSLLTALLGVSSERVWMMLLVQHAVACLMLAAFTWRLLPVRFRYPRPQVGLLLFNFSFFIPVLGALGVLGAVLAAGYRRQDAAVLPAASLSLPEFTPSLRAPAEKGNQAAGLRSRLAHTSVAPTQRLQSLLALQSMPHRVSSPLLQNMLGDASDDIRLVAYGLLDTWEKRITSQIHRELESLKAAEGKELRVMCQRQLAELYWELAYSGLVQGDLRDHALEQALAYADQTLLLEPQEQGMWFLKGRILHEMEREDEAYEIFEAARANGLPESRVLPYLAEIAFDRGDYRSVRNLLSRISTDQVTPIMKDVIHFWVSRTAHHWPAVPDEEGV